MIFLTLSIVEQKNVSNKCLSAFDRLQRILLRLTFRVTFIILNVTMHFFHDPFDALFNSLQKRIKVLGWKNDQCKRYFNFDVAKLIV